MSTPTSTPMSAETDQIAALIASFANGGAMSPIVAAEKRVHGYTRGADFDYDIKFLVAASEALAYGGIMSAHQKRNLAGIVISRAQVMIGDMFFGATNSLHSPIGVPITEDRQARRREKLIEVIKLAADAL